MGAFLGPVAQLARRKAAEHRDARRREAARGPRSRFEGAEYSGENRDHFRLADGLSAVGAYTREVRRRLFERARYERDNDGHLDGLCKQVAYDLVGTGPRLQMMLADEYADAAREVEQSFAAWCRAAGAAEQLRLMHEVRAPDGESFGLIKTNPGVPHPVKLALEAVETEQVDDPTLDTDGIKFDAAGNPTAYSLLRQHPGDSNGWAARGGSDWVPAKFMCHWFRPRRPAQRRGVSELAAALLVGAQTRRYAAAVLTAAEFAAMLAGVMTTDAPAPDGDESAPSVRTMQDIEMPRGALLTLPQGWKAEQFAAQQPTGTYEGFVTSKRAEMGRPLLAPRNLVTGDSSDFNFASGRLDQLPYQDIVWVERDRFRQRVLDKLFLAWLAEAELVGLVPDGLPAVNEWVWDWHWDAFSHLDPVKETAAVESRLRLCLTTLAEECAARGLNWREVVDQRAKERDYMLAKGLNPDAAVGLAVPPDPAPAGGDQ